jgi:hypothetical protein
MDHPSDRIIADRVPARFAAGCQRRDVRTEEGLSAADVPDVPPDQGADGAEDEHGGQQVAQGSGVRELSRETGTVRARRQEHEAEVPERVQEEDGSSTDAGFSSRSLGRRLSRTPMQNGRACR